MIRLYEPLRCRSVLCFTAFYRRIAGLEQPSGQPEFRPGHFASPSPTVRPPLDAISYLDRAIELSPRDPHRPVPRDTAAHFARYLTLPRSSHESHAHSERQSPPFAILVSLLGLMDRAEETPRAADSLLERVSPCGRNRPDLISSLSNDPIWGNAT
jgi:hypothetical protein